MLYVNTEILITEMEVSNQAKNVIPLKFLRKIKNTFFSSIRGHTVCTFFLLLLFSVPSENFVFCTVLEMKYINKTNINGFKAQPCRTPDTLRLRQ
jgi:hypothetical protein